MITNEAEAKAYIAECFGEGVTKTFQKLEKLLIEENAKQNLVAGGSLPQFWQRHIVDSAQLLKHVSRETGVWLDMGSGAGFPGLVVAACRPRATVHLVESRRLRIEWLNRMIDRLDLSNCSIQGHDLGAVPTFPVDVISARAFAPMPRLVSMAARFSTPDTQWVLPKGRKATHDVEMLDPRLREMFHVKPSITDPDAGIVVGYGKAEFAR